MLQRAISLVSVKRGVLTLGGLGYLPRPGVIGALAASAGLFFVWPHARVWLQLPIILVITIIALWLVRSVRDEAHDPSYVVIDELLGLMVATLVARGAGEWAGAVLLFLVFDFLKPWPASFFDRMVHPAGIVLDDIAAGGYALGVFALYQWLI